MSSAVQAAPTNVVVVDNASENFVNKVTSLPVVASTLNQVYSAYNWTKDSNGVVRYTLEAAEKSVAVAANTAKPVVDRLEKPISMANDLACKQLDKIQENLPIISEPTEKVVSTIQDSTWHMLENTKKASSEQVNHLLNTRVGKVVTSGLDMALDASNNAIEYYLPPDEEEKNDLEEDEDDDEIPPEKQESGEPSPSTASIEKMGKVSTKLRRRLYRRALKNIQYAQKRSSETVEKLQFTVNLIDYAKSNIDGANTAIRSRVETTQKTLWTTWNDWTTEEGEVDQGEKAGDENVEGKAICRHHISYVNNKKTKDKKTEDLMEMLGLEKTVDQLAKNGEERTLAIARNLAGRLRILSHNIASSVRILPKHLHTRVEEARDLADSVYQSFEEAKYFSDLPSSLLTRAQEQLDRLQDTTKAVAEYLVNSWPLQLLVVDMELGQIEFDYIAGSDQNDVDLSTDSSEF